MAYFPMLRNMNLFSSKTCGLPLGLARRTITNQSEVLTLQKNITSQDDLPVTLEYNPYEKEKKQCILCRLNIEPDYKNVRMLSQFQSRFTGRVFGRHITGLCKNKQDKLEREISKAQNAGFMGYYTKAIEYVKDPKLFNPDYPFRPHKY